MDCVAVLSYYLKIEFLKESLLFSHWPMDELVKLAYAMRKKIYSKGSIILRQGDRVDYILILKKGNVKIIHKMSKQKSNKLIHFDVKGDSKINSSTNSSGLHEVIVDIAELGPHDLIGVVEAMTNSKKM